MRTLIFDSLPSTNDYLKTLSGILPWLGVLALEQTSGRGRMSRIWHAEPGSSFTYSVYLPSSEYPFQLGLVAASAGVEALECQASGLPMKIKWPNDLYCNDRKLGGTLVESHQGNLIMGIGINLNQESFPEEIQTRASSLFLQAERKIGVKNFLNLYQEFFLENYSLWIQDPSVFLQRKVVPRLAWLGKRIRIDYGGQRQDVEGVLCGIDSNGFLLVETESKIETISTGDLKLWLQR